MKGKREVEHIVIVDENDNIIGEEEKEKCHDGGGILHRAFLAMVFTDSGQLVLTRRSERKRLWPGFWDGTVASHVVKGEDYEEASKRRLHQEIGLIKDKVEYLFKFYYKAGYENIGTEHEICAVTIVNDISVREIFPNSDEISEIDLIEVHTLMDDLRMNKNRYTPWFVLAVEHMRERQLLK